jgi:uncharacterized protein (DUF305 family)
MDGKWIAIAALIMLTIANMQSHENEAQSATPTVGWPPAPTTKFVASTEKTFDQLMADAMSVMHRDMHNAGYSGEADHDFVKMMIPHHQGAIDTAKAVLLYGKDPQIRRLAQEIITDQRSEIQLMQLWLKQRNNANAQSPTLNYGR